MFNWWKNIKKRSASELVTLLREASEGPEGWELARRLPDAEARTVTAEISSNTSKRMREQQPGDTLQPGEVIILFGRMDTDPLVGVFRKSAPGIWYMLATDFESKTMPLGIDRV